MRSSTGGRLPTPAPGQPPITGWSSTPEQGKGRKDRDPLVSTDQAWNEVAVTCAGVGMAAMHSKAADAATQIERRLRVEGKVFTVFLWSDVPIARCPWCASGGRVLGDALFGGVCIVMVLS